MKYLLPLILGIITVVSGYTLVLTQINDSTTATQLGTQMTSSVWLINAGLPQWFTTVTDGCAEWSSNVLTTTGTTCASGGGGGGLFTYNSGTDTISPLIASTSNTANLTISWINATSTASSSIFAGGLVSSASSTFSGTTWMYGTTTWASGIHPVAHGFYAADSSGLHLHSNNGTEVAYFGAGGGANVTFPAYTSALLQTGASGAVAEYAGTSCTNQFVRALSALGIATCATVDISADTNLVAGTNITLTDDTLNVDDAFLANSGDTGTGTFDFTGATLNLAAGVIDAITEIASGLKSGIDATLVTGTAGTSGNLGEWNGDGDLVDSSLATANIPLLNGEADYTGTHDFDGATVAGMQYYPAFAWATTTTGTTTQSLGAAFNAQTWGKVACWSESGVTTAYQFGDGTNWMEYRTATSGVSIYALSTNNSFTAGEKRYVRASSTAINLTCTVSFQDD